MGLHGPLKGELYIYIFRYIHISDFFFLWRYSHNLGLGLTPWTSPFHFVLLELTHSVGLFGRVISSSQGLYLYTNTEKRARTNTHTLNIHALSRIGTHDPGFRASKDLACLRRLGYHDRLCFGTATVNSNISFNYYSRHVLLFHKILTSIQIAYICLDTNTNIHGFICI
jgi:hypothetical protein